MTSDKAANAADRGPDEDPEAPLYSTVPLEDENGETYVIQQQNVGPDNEQGGGEWPDPHAPPRLPAPGPRRRVRTPIRPRELVGHRPVEMTFARMVFPVRG